MIAPRQRETLMQTIKGGGHSTLQRPHVLPIALALLALSPCARAVMPPPDGGYDSFNTAEGEFALHELLPGPANTALGASALYSTTTGSVNTATGSAALFENTTGSKNTANGQNALKSNTTGSNNTATGHVALGNENTTGSANTATGRWALLFSSTSNNTATSWSALQGSTRAPAIRPMVPMRFMKMRSLKTTPAAETWPLAPPPFIVTQAGATIPRPA